MKLLDAIDKLNVWKRHGERAPHKPLLILYALARQISDPEAKFEFSVIEKDIENLLNKYGRPQKKGTRQKPFEPFWRLQNDGIWEVRSDEKIEPDVSGSVSVVDLRNYNATGFFVAEVAQEIKENPDVALQAAQELLNEHFTESLRPSILQCVGFDHGVFSAKKYLARKTKRDRRFRENVLHAYRYSCAVCGFNLRIKTSPVGLEAAHIKWHQHGGPDTEDNGLALCATHHKLLDSGVMTLSEDYKILLSEWVFDPDGENSFIKEHHKREINLPMNRRHSPAADYIRWHRKEVFKEPAIEGTL